MSILDSYRIKVAVDAALIRYPKANDNELVAHSYRIALRKQSLADKPARVVIDDIIAVLEQRLKRKLCI